ncbi:MAG: hypothetical protein RB191_07470 [Terriglobia bacterium]|nr:hypothetical protein [Terriglobia bacterium]
MTKQSDSYSSAETKKRFEKILRGAMHKPTSLKDIPKKRKERPVKSRSAPKKEAP